jgi:hypothetical protein
MTGRSSCGKQVTMPDATKSSLEGLPEFEYAPD